MKELGVTPQQVAKLTNMIVSGDISATAAAAISDAVVLDEDLDPSTYAKEHNLLQKSDVGELEGIVEQVLSENPKAVDDVKSGGKKSKKAEGFLLGQVIQKTRGQANPKVVSEIISKKLS